MTKNRYVRGGAAGLKAGRAWALRNLVLVCTLLCSALWAQVRSNPAQQLVFAGLRTVAQQGQVNGVKTDAAGNLYLLLNQGDGVRLLKTDSAGANVLAQAQLGARGDVGVALAIDPAGNLYVAGTTNSSVLTGTSGAAIPARTDGTTQSFVAKFDANLNPLFVTFTGGSRIAATAVAATADAVFVSGITYAANLPVTANGIQQQPAYESTQSGFVERFSPDGSTLVYATYLTGAAGSTTPAGIAADASDAAYIAGQTTASGFPTVAALVPVILSNPSGFLTKLTPAGDGVTFSTFVPGEGLTSVALDSTGSTLLVSGSVALGQFPVDTVTAPLAAANYQVLLRIPVSGNAVESATVLAPGTASNVAAGANGGAWVDGVLTTPLLPLAPLAGLGVGFAEHVPAGAAVDQAVRFGGLANEQPAYASLGTVLTSVAVDASGESIVAGSVNPTASSSLLATETYDLPLRNAPTAALPSGVGDAELSAANCSGSVCAGSAAYVAKVSLAAGVALAFSADDLPFVVLRNLGSSEADGLTLTATNAAIASNCPQTLYAGGECDVLLSGSAAGTLTASSAGGSQTIAFGPYATPANGLVYFPKELDFGIVSSATGAVTKTITLTNLGSASATFTSALDVTANPKAATISPFSEVASNCTLASAQTTKVLVPGGTCHITVGLTAFSSAASDGPVTAEWSIGTRDVLLTGYSQALALGVSATEVDFGTQFTNGIRLPRYLYLSNASTAPVPHAAVSLPAGSAFTVTDSCPETLPAQTVCRIRIDYQAAQATSSDSVTLALDEGLSVLVTGQTLPPRTVTGATVNPFLTVSATSVSFGTAVDVTGVSGSTQTVTIGNSGTAAFALSLALTGDFADTTNCGASLAGGQTCTVTLSFVPSAPGARNGLLTVTAGANTTPVYVTLNGTGTPILPANNGTLNFGSVAVGEPVTQFYKVSQSFSALTATATGPYKVILVEDAGFGPGSPSAAAFAATASGTCFNCYLGVQFLPTATGVQTGTLTLTSATGGSPYVLTLTGAGVATTGLVLTPVTQDFGAVPVHSTSAAQLFTLTNLTFSQTAVTVAAPTLTGDFTTASATTGGPACGGSLAYSASCVVSVSFSPTTTGSRTGTLTLAAGGTSVSAVLTGSGTTDPGIALNPVALTFNNVPGMQATEQNVTVTNTSSAAVSVGAVSAATSSFATQSNCASLAPGAMCSIAVTFLPGSATTTDVLSIPVTTTAGTPATSTYSVALNGAYTSATAGLEIVPAQTEFGPSPTQTPTAPRQFTINNLTAKTVALAITIPRQFVLTSAPCTTLAPNASCSLSLAFLPLDNGDIPGTLYAIGTPSDGSPALAGIGYVEGYGVGSGLLTVTGALIVDGVYNFGQVTSGQTLAQTFTLANLNPAGWPSITVRRVTSGAPFMATTNCGTALAVGQSCEVTVTFAPSNQVASGTDSPATTPNAGTLTIESDAASSPNVINLIGQAAPLAVGSVANASTLATYTLSESSLSFAQTQVGDVSAPQTITLTNTGNVSIAVSSVFATPDFSVQNTCATVAPAASCTITVEAAPQTPGVKVASLEIVSNAADTLEFVSLLTSASSSPLTLSASTLNFGPVLLGNSATLPVTVTNTGASAVTFTSVGATGDYAVSSNCPPAGQALAAGTSCTVQVTFTPGATGTRTGTLNLATSASTNPITVALTGVGTQSTLSISPSSLAFGSIAVAASANLPITFTNTGSAPITGLTLTTTGDFAVTIPCPSTTLAGGASCTAQITFTPAAVGMLTGSLTVISSDARSPAIVALSGTGVQGGSFLITVDGAASASATVVSGQPATYQLAVTPVGGFAGSVALTCTPVSAGEYATCSLLPSALDLANGPQTATVTINTITETAASGPLRRPGSLLETVLACLMFPGIWTAWRGRQQLRSRLPLLASILLAAISLVAAGCGGSPAPTPMLYTPAGTYQYSVTASSTSGVTVTQTVTLNLTVTAR